MISECADYCRLHALSFNPVKSKIMVFSRTNMTGDRLKPIILNGTAINVVNQIKYLGTSIVSNPALSFLARPDLQSFYRSANSILNVLKKPDVLVQMHLLYANCVPILSYASSVKEYSAREMMDCNTAVNDAIRKIFSYNRWESVRELRNGCGYKSLTEIFAIAREKFQNSLCSHANSIVCRLHSINLNVLT